MKRVHLSLYRLRFKPEEERLNQAIAQVVAVYHTAPEKLGAKLAELRRMKNKLTRGN